MNLDDLPEICSDRDLAKFFGKTPATIREWCNRGDLTWFPFGNKYYVKKVDLIADIEKKTCQGKVAEPISNGARIKRRGTSMSTSEAAKSAKARALQNLHQRRMMRSKNTSSAKGRS